MSTLYIPLTAVAFGVILRFFDVAVIGGGIAGLSTALALKRGRLTVRIRGERASCAARTVRAG